MIKRTWSNPEVRLVLGRERVNVNSLEIAAQILLSDNWQLHDSTCERAAAAYEAAAREADILVR
jgi:hypothetical protein